MLSARRILHGFIGLARMVAVEVTNAMVGAGGAMSDTAHNIEQTFGEHTAVVEKAVDGQVKAFSRGRTEFLRYAEEVGRSLQNLGISEAKSAEVAAKVIEGASRLAASRRITPAEAMGEIKGRGALFDDARIKAMAIEQHLISNRNQAIDSGTEALLRYELALETIAMRTEDVSGTTMTWSGQIQALGDNLANLATTIGTTLEPLFANILATVNDVIIGLEKWIKIIQQAVKFATFHAMGYGLEEAMTAATAEVPRPERADITARNEAEAARARRQRILGEVMGGGGGGGGRGFQGGLAEFARKVQESAFSQKQLVVQEKQLAQAMELNVTQKTMLELQKKAKSSKGPEATF